jgi:outer membrane protein TolC
VNREIALLRLKQLLDLAPGDDLRVADVLADDLLPPPPVFAARVTAVESVLGRGAVEEAFAIAPPAINRAAAQDAATAVTVREAALDAVRAQRMPAVSVTSNYGRIAYPSNPVAPSFDRTNWTVGANLQVPILTGGRQRADEAVAQAELDQTRDRLRQVEELAALDTRSAWAELIAARATWEATAGTVQQANRAYELADIRYQAGVSTQLELSDSRLLLQQAEANRAQAARDLQVARARVALLPDLPLGPGGTVAPGGGQPLPAVPQQPAPQGGGGQIRTAAAQGGAQQFGGQP